jgi:uncharacterized protein
VRHATVERHTPMADMLSAGPPPAPTEEPTSRPTPAPATVVETPLVLEPEGGLTPKKIGSFVLTALVVVLAPLTFTVLLGLYQTVRPEKVLSTVTPKDVGLAFEDVVLTTADGLRLAAWYVPAVTPSDAAVVVLHGYPADKGDLLSRAAFLAQTYDLLLIDFRSFGKSEGSYTTLGPKEVEDVLAAVRYLDEVKKKSRIGVYGFSMGGTVALTSLAKTDRVDAVVSEAAWGDNRLMAEQPYRYLGPLKTACAALTVYAARVALGVDVDAASPVRAAKEAKVPILLIHSRRDQVVPFIHAELLASALGSNPALETWFTDELGHGEPSLEFPARVQAFFDTHLKSQNPTP